MILQCRLCGSGRLKYFYSIGYKDEFDYYRCENCKMVNLNMDNMDFSDHQGQYFARFAPIEDYENEFGAKQAYQFLKKHLTVKGKFLDIGCGSGGVLYFARKDGWKVQGLEISPDFARYVKTRLGINVDVGDFLEYESGHHDYDLVSLRHVLEHLPNPVFAMNKISSFLVDGGYAHFEFPNIMGLPHRVKRFTSKAGIKKNKFRPYFKPGHCNEFSRRSFQYLLEQTGFRLIRWETYSFKPLKNYIYNQIHLGVKARAIVQKVNQDR